MVCYTVESDVLVSGEEAVRSGREVHGVTDAGKKNCNSTEEGN